MYFAVFSRDNFKRPQKFLIGGKLKMTANVKIAAKSTFRLARWGIGCTLKIV